MDETIIVLVSDKDDSKHGEISILDDPQKAERLVETLLQAGFDESRIRVFNGRSSEFEVNHRPVVALADGSSKGTRRPAVGGKSREGKAGEPAATVESRDDKVEEPAAAAESRDDKVEEPAATVESRDDKVEEPAAVAESRDDKVEEPAAVVETGYGKVEARAAEVAVAQSQIQEPPKDEMTEEEEARATAETAAPVRFSSLFRSS